MGVVDEEGGVGTGSMSSSGTVGEIPMFGHRKLPWGLHILNPLFSRSILLAMSSVADIVFSGGNGGAGGAAFPLNLSLSSSFSDIISDSWFLPVTAVVSLLVLDDGGGGTENNNGV